MTAWLLTISKDFAQHWDYAKSHGLWDMITPRNIDAGDEIYFWQSGASFVGKVRALTSAQAIEASSVTPGPWDDWPGAPGKPYAFRFQLEVLASTSVAQPTWTEVSTATGLSMNASFVRTVSPRQQAILDGYIFGAAEPETTLDDARRREILESLNEDLRVRRLQLVALRQGQPVFRRALLSAYAGRCAITGTNVASVLEAAHISSHKGEHTNEVWNGLLLRADLHTLFDLHLITVDSTDLRVRVAPSLKGSDYARLEGVQLSTPGTLTEHPSPEVLAAHNAECTWL